jgi:hypothetical protein
VIAGLAVAEAAANGENVHARVNQHRYVRVPQCVERDGWQLQGHNGTSLCAADSVRFEQPPLYVTKH